MGRMSKSEGWEGGEEGFASLREPHTGLAADSCCKTSSSASRFNERRWGLRRESQHRGPRDGVNVMRQR
ncbi:MAG: hypothetical protein II592_04710 [Muribaculaceae bacterium]|nr:hypothetical protein [Muribaculaceae bacterium]